MGINSWRINRTWWCNSKKLAAEGYGIIGFHFDRGEAKQIAKETIEEVNELTGGRCHYYNTNAASEEAMDKYIPEIKEITGGKPLKLLLHSIAFGTTTNFFGKNRLHNVKWI